MSSVQMHFSFCFFFFRGFQNAVSCVNLYALYKDIDLSFCERMEHSLCYLLCFALKCEENDPKFGSYIIAERGLCVREKRKAKNHFYFLLIPMNENVVSLSLNRKMRVSIDDLHGICFCRCMARLSGVFDSKLIATR